jgi:hypothetical protein
MTPVARSAIEPAVAALNAALRNAGAKVVVEMVLDSGFVADGAVGHQVNGLVADLRVVPDAGRPTVRPYP